MRWDRSHQSSDLDDLRGAGGGRGAGFPLLGAIALGSRWGWKGILIALLVIGGLTYGTGMCSSLTGGGSAPTQTRNPAPVESNDRKTPDDEMKRFVGFVFDDVQDSWARQLQGYEKTRLVLFSDAIQSACGTATAAVGPFYCPLDHKVYIDLAFYDDLRRQFGAPGDFAQAYVIAHEVGHHVQNLMGGLNQGDVDQIDVELQADCLAGAWARDAQSRNELELGDIDEALNAASQIGDDTIQRKTQGRVQPETWTHGSAAQRSSSFKKGLEGGAGACGIR